jgi:hypothetical protein
VIWTDAPVRTLVLKTGDQPLSEQLGWNAVNVVVDNFTNQYLYLPDAQRFVAPGQFGAVIPLPGPGRAQAVFQSPPLFVQAPLIAGQQATLVFMSAGVLASPSAGLISEVQLGAETPLVLGSTQPVNVPPPATPDVYPIPVGSLAVGVNLAPNSVGGAGQFVQLSITGVQSGQKYFDSLNFEPHAGLVQYVTLNAADTSVSVTIVTSVVPPFIPGPIPIAVVINAAEVLMVTSSASPPLVGIGGSSSARLTDFQVGVAPALPLPGTPLASRSVIRITNPGAASIWVGYASTVTAGAATAGGTQGVEIMPGTTWSFGLSKLQQIWGCTAAGNVVVQLEEA